MNPARCTPRRTAPRVRSSGWTAVELIFALAIVAVGLMVVVQQISIGIRETDNNEHRAFAYQKASAILQEVQFAIDSGEIASGEDLYAMVDTAMNPVLTTRRDVEGLVVAPDHSMSGNVKRSGAWAWARKIGLSAHDQAGLYYVRVEIHRRADSRWEFEANQTALLSLLPNSDAPVQSFDVYALAIANAPSLLGEMSQLRSELQNAVSALSAQSRARFRIHWITRLGYGRDPCYAPFVNTAVTADKAAPHAYWLPGLLGSGTQQSLFTSDLLGGLHRTEAGLVNGWSETNPRPYTLADRFNHCLRAPAARAEYQARLALGLEREDEPPLQVLLDRMVEEPTRFRGAIFVNLHGNALPMPPLRNVSDPAKDPVAHPGVRVVTHPGSLRTKRSHDGDKSDAVELRVHAWRSPMGGSAVLGAPILVQIHGLDLTSAINTGAEELLEIRRLPGGINTTTGGTGTAQYEKFDSSQGVPPRADQSHAAYEMYYEAGYVGGDAPYTWLRLYNTPLTAPKVGDRGLDPLARVYGVEHNPSPVTANDGFDRDLSTDASTTYQQRNTARWRIRVTNRVFRYDLLPNVDTVLRVTTRIGTNVNTGIRWPTPNAPHNISETYTWWADSATDVPPTERAQFQGDPRLCPYVDLMRDGDTTRHGHNWHFDDLVNGVATANLLYTCFENENLLSGFGQRTRDDAPRFFELFRRACEASGAVFVNPAGRFADHLLLGGEIALPAVPLATGSAPVELEATFGGGSGKMTVDTAGLSGADLSGTPILCSNAITTWWNKPFLGELFPDAAAVTWIADGNLPLGRSGATFFWRAPRSPDPPNLPVGTVFPEVSGSAIGLAGSAMALNRGGPAATYVHTAASGARAAASATTVEMFGAFQTAPEGPFAAARPFALDTPLVAPYAFLQTDVYPRHSATLLETLWTSDQSGKVAGGVIDFELSDQRAFLVACGFTPTLLERPAVLRQALQGGVRGVLVAGRPGHVGRVREVPFVTIVEPPPGTALIDPTGLQLRWTTDFLRFDGARYTPQHPDGFAEDESQLVYRVLYTRDLGVTWSSLLTGEPATPGTYPTDTADRLDDTGIGEESYSVLLPSDTFTTGEYVFRIEAWNRDRRVHDGSHQVRVFLRRT